MIAQISLDKDKLRSLTLARRDRMDAVERIEKSLAACDHGFASLQVGSGQTVSGFWPIRSEIDPRPLMSSLREKGACLCLPVVVNKTTIEFRELTRETSLVDTGFGTRGPGPDARTLVPEIMLVPLAAYDSAGGRIGYGAGFYDRYIDRLHQMGKPPLLAGFAFHCQMVDKVPMEPHDQRLQLIITDAGTIPVKS